MSYFDELFKRDEINEIHPIGYTQEGHEYSDENAVVFHHGDYIDDDMTLFVWYGCDYFVDGSESSKKCPIVGIEVYYTETLDGYFGDAWKEPFKKWFWSNFHLPVTTVD